MTAAKATDAEGTLVVQLFRWAPVRTTLVAVAVVNWFVFFAVSANVGGVAIGTTPSTQGFVVRSKGKITPVSERQWVVALFYPLATLCLTPAVFFSIVATQFRRIERPAGRVALVAFILIWCGAWYWAMWRDGGRSVRDYRMLKAADRALPEQARERRASSREDFGAMGLHAASR